MTTAGEGVAPAPALGGGLPELLADAWLVVVDPQRVFADPGSPWGSPMFAGALGPVRDLAGASGLGPDRTLVTRWLPDRERQGSWADYFARWSFADRPDEDPLFDLVPDATGLSSRPTVDARTFGKWGDPLRQVVGPAPTLVLAGVSTDCCVVATALAAADGGARVLIAADACAGSSPEAHAAALQVMGLYDPQIRLVTSADVVGALADR